MLRHITRTTRTGTARRDSTEHTQHTRPKRCLPCDTAAAHTRRGAVVVYERATEAEEEGLLLWQWDGDDDRRGRTADEQWIIEISTHAPLIRLRTKRTCRRRRRCRGAARNQCGHRRASEIIVVVSIRLRRTRDFPTLVQRGEGRGKY